jgi:hypothetical protein
MTIKEERESREKYSHVPGVVTIVAVFTALAIQGITISIPSLPRLTMSELLLLNSVAILVNSIVTILFVTGRR